MTVGRRFFNRESLTESGSCESTDPSSKDSSTTALSKQTTRSARISDDGQEVEEEDIVTEAVPCVSQPDELREKLLSDADAQYRVDLAYRDRLLQDSSDEDVRSDVGSNAPLSQSDSAFGPHVKQENSADGSESVQADDGSQSNGIVERKKQAKYHGVSQSLMRRVWSSSEDESQGFQPKPENVEVKELKKDENTTQDTKSDEEVANTRKKRSRSIEDSDSVLSSDESARDDVIPQKKQRRAPLDANENCSTNNKPRSQSEKSHASAQSDETDEDDTDSDSISTKRQKRRRKTKGPQKERGHRRRVRLEAGSDDDNSDENTGAVSESSRDPNDPQETGSESGSDGGKSGSPKGRKRIRKIVGKAKLSATTKSAEAEERERKKRLAERQKLYNDCLIQEGFGTQLVTKKLVLEKSEDGTKDLVQVHPDLLKHLKPHQVEAVQFLWDCVIESVDNQDEKNEQTRGAILAHCMGLGKTLSVIAFLHTLMSHPDIIRIRTCLVICPVNTLLNWKNEWEIWLPPNDPLDVYELSARPENRQRVDVIKHWHNQGGVLLLGYDMFRNFIIRFAKQVRSKAMKEAISKALLDPGPDIIVCDEGHVLKNCRSALAKAMSQVRTLKHHAMVNFVKPNLLGTAKEFNNRFANPIRNGQHSNSTQADVQLMKKRAHVLYKTLDGCVQRKDYVALTEYLPPRYEYVIKCRLSTVQQELYRHFLQYREERGLNDADDEFAPIRRKTLFTDQQVLYRIWTHPFLLCSHETREARKMLLEDDDEDDFINDDPTSESSSDNPGANESSNSAEEDADEVIPSTSSGLTRAQRCARRGPRTRSSVTNDLICMDGDSAREENNSQLSGDDDDRALPARDSWWAAHYREEYDWDVSVGVKLDVLLRILKKTCVIGDKLIIFTQSLLSLDLLERFLSELHRQYLASQASSFFSFLDNTNSLASGLAPEKSNKTTDDRGLLERPDLSEYFSDIGPNSWVRGEDYERMDGSTHAVVRKELQRRFNRVSNTRLRLFLISTRAGGLGINLIAANRIILFDACWNPSHDIQSIFRCYRFGQTKPVYIYRLIAQGTMEEKIYDRQVTKQSLSLRVIDEQQIDRHFTTNDLKALYTFEPDLWDLATADQRPTPKLPKDRLLADLLSENPSLIVNYHEHDSLLEHREDEGLTEEQRQEAWREYEEEKQYGMSLAQHQRLMQQQELHARMMRMQFQQQQLMLQQQQQQLQQQPRFPLNPYLYRPTAPTYGTFHPAIRNAGPMTPEQGNGMVMGPPTTQLNGNMYAELYEYFRTQLLSARPSLSGDPEQLKRLIMGNMMDHLVRTKALEPTNLQSTSNVTPTTLNQPGGPSQ
ncbi:unnamed protein product [Echinostoma caproni]|uniref:Transcriptional regulator ATRX homolog n=1 Tax=Echinostoma caproni TaxID=27848 RepID=A0A183AST1_9TREM|nr:unnamed protein product [Echinostoma caproni]